MSVIRECTQKKYYWMLFLVGEWFLFFALDGRSERGTNEPMAPLPHISLGKHITR